MPGGTRTSLNLTRLHRFCLFLIFSWIILLLSPPLSAQAPLPGADRPVTVERVIDGDTIELNGGEKIRYIGIDAPELHRRIGGRWTRVDEPFAKEALALNRSLVEGREVRLEYDREFMDRYRRFLAYVFIGEEMVNAELIEAGLAKVAIHPPNRKYAELFEESEKRAREEKRGLWGDAKQPDEGGN